MRTDVTEIGYEDMSPELRALIVYEGNGALDVVSPQAAIDAVRAQSPVVRWELGVGFFGMDDVLAAAKNPDIVSANPQTGVPFGMGSEEPLIPLHFDGESHRRFRKLLDPLFAPKKMALLEPAIRKLADELIDGFAGAGQAELHDQFCVPLPSTVFLTLFGMPLEDMPALIEFKDRILKNEGVTMEEREALGVAAGKEMDVHLRRRLEERRATAARFDDLLDTFMHFELDGDRLSDDEVVNIMHMFTIAGLDTVTSSMSCILAWLATHPEVRHRVVADPSLLAPTIEELMRVESPVPSGGARWAVRDTEVNGVPVKAGELVFLCWASANVDPAVFDRPLEVDIERPGNRHVAFAAGFHRCLGSHLARNELRVAIDQLHRRIPDYWVTEGEGIRFELAGVRQAIHLPVSFAPAP
jgi:cytochrome P450